MRLRWTDIGILVVASVPSAAWLACGAKTENVPGLDAGTDAAREAAPVDGARQGADGFMEGASAPDGGGADVMVGDGAFSSPPGNDGGADASSRGDAETDTGPADAGSHPIADTGSADMGAEASAFGCPTYCAMVMAACTGGNAQYKDMASCLNACQYFPPGNPGQWAGDNLACRIVHAGYATTAPNPHCWHAGPFGYGGCGALYEGFCDIAAGHLDMQTPSGFCSLSGGFDAGAAAYTSNSDCTLRAASYSRVNMETGMQPPGRVGLDGGFNADGPAAGNTFDCRAYHLVLALQGGSTQQVECSNVGWSSPTCQ